LHEIEDVEIEDRSVNSSALLFFAGPAGPGHMGAISRSQL
jgi:hypothetical protein